MATPLSEQTLSTARLLVQSTEDQLFAELALVARGMKQDPALAGQVGATVVHDATMMGPFDDLVPFGKKLFRRLAREAHGLLCGSDETDKEDRESLMAALGVDKAQATAMLTPLLVANLGLAPAIAAIVAALLIGRVFKPTWEEMCKAWGESLEADG